MLDMLIICCEIKKKFEDILIVIIGDIKYLCVVCLDVVVL